jgi:hypothetical protein
MNVLGMRSRIWSRFLFASILLGLAFGCELKDWQFYLLLIGGVGVALRGLWEFKKWYAYDNPGKRIGP